MDKKQYEIIKTRGYYEVHYNGKFFCTADTYAEAEAEIKEVIKNESINSRRF